jgi:hypothetical protein
MTPEQITKPTEAQCKRFTLAIGECWHEWECDYSNFHCIKCWYRVNSSDYTPKNPTYTDSASILEKMREKLGEEKYSKFIYQLSSQYFDKNGITRIGQQARLINFLNDYIFNPAALIDKALEFMRKEKGE